MKLFLLIFLTIYTLMHLLSFWGLYPLLRTVHRLPAVTALWMLLMIVAPLLVRYSESAGFERFAQGLSWTAYSWMGGLFIAFSLFSLLALWELAVRLLRLLSPLAANLSLQRPAVSLLLLLIIISTSLYAFSQAGKLTVEKVSLGSSKWPNDKPPLRIVQISDLHLGLMNRNNRLQPLIDKIQQLQPDLVVATGDIVDAQLDHLETLANDWHQLKPPLGLYAVTGNHEIYAGLPQALAYLEQSGFVLLRNQVVAVGEHLQLVGVDDPGHDGHVDEQKLFRQKSERFTLFLKHQPKIDPRSADYFDLQLSGHTHAGQIFPFNFLVKLQFPHLAGLHRLNSDSWLYISRGSGTWGPPMRLFAPAEITLIEISGATP